MDGCTGCCKISEIVLKVALNTIYHNQSISNDILCLPSNPVMILSIFTRFYVGCDRCQDWFHCECVGITQKEADELDSYICPNCQRKDQEDPTNLKELDDRDYDLLFKLLRSLQVSDH